MAYAQTDKRELADAAYLSNPAPNVRTREKMEGGRKFVLKTEFEPAGDQPTAIVELSEGVKNGERDQVLLGATGTGKTFTMAKIIEETQRPAIILAPNKTLAAQLYGEFKGFFPGNAVEYFVSYYDYYQPEAYVARSDTYIEKESQINEQIDRMRHSATRALLERDDVIIVASVSCIYGIGSVETYGAMTQDIHVGKSYDQRKIMADLIAQQYRRNDAAFQRGTFRVRGDSLEIFPAHLDDRAWRLSFFGEELESITEFDPLTGDKTDTFPKIRVYANSHYVTPGPTMKQAAEAIKWILGIGTSLVGRLLLVDVLTMEFREIAVEKDPGCPVCGSGELQTPEAEVVSEITVGDLRKRLVTGAGPVLVDVREATEHHADNLGGRLIPLGQLDIRAFELDDVRDRDIVVYCASGGRSARGRSRARSSGHRPRAASPCGASH